MASYSEIKERVKKYGVSGAGQASEDYRLNNASNKEKNDKDDEKSSYVGSERYEKIKEKVYSSIVTKDYINTFVSDANNFFGTVEEEYNSLGWSNASSAYDTRRNTWQDLETRAGYIGKWLEQNKGIIDEETYNSLSSTLDSIESNGAPLVKSFMDVRDFYAQFDTEDAYNEWRKVEDEKKAVLEAEDFDVFTQKGSEIDNPTWDDTFAPLDIAGWKPFGEGEKVNNMVTFAEANSANAIGASGNAFRGGGQSSDQVNLINLINNHMTDEEKSIYNYYVGKGYTKKANAYLTALTDTLNQRAAGKMVEQADGNALELVFSAVAGLDQFASGVRNLDNYILGTEADTTSAIQYAQGAMSSNNEGIWKVSNDLVNTTGNMFPSIVVGYFTGGLGGALTLGTSAVGNAYAEMRNHGYDEWQSRGYATLVGASETALQYFIGGVSKLGGKLTGNAIGNFISKFDNAIAKTAIKLGGNMLSEGLEEAIQTALEPAYKAIFTGEDFEAAEWEDILYSGLLGALSAGFLEGAPTIANTAVSNHNAKKVFGDGSALVDEALQYSTEGSELRSLAEKYNTKIEGGKKLSGQQINNLNEAIKSEDTANIRKAIIKTLNEYGETHNVDAVADVLVKQALGEKLSSKDVRTLNESDKGHIVSAELNEENIQSGGLSNKWAEQIGTRRINPKAYNKELYEIASQMAERREAVEKDSVAKTLADAEKAIDTKIEVSESGKTIYKDAKGDSHDVTVNRIVSTEGGIKVELDNGETVSAKDLTFGSHEEALMYEMVTRMDVTPETANELINTFKPTKTNQASMYFTNIPLAYQYGTIGYEAGLKNINLSEKEKRVAYNRGRMDAMTKAKSQPNATASKKGDSKNASSTKKGIVYENGFTYDESTANEMQKQGMAGAEVINKMSNLEVHVFASEVQADGKRVAFVNGKLVTAPNGYFVDGNKIYIDFNSGNGGQGAMLYTMSHEITHYIRKWNAKGFKELGDFLIAEYGKKGVVVNALIEHQKDKIKDRYKREKKTLPNDAKLFDMAYEELVADAMSDMLADPRAYEKLAKLKQKNRSVWKEFGEAIKNLLDKLKSALGLYRKNAPVAQEAFLVRDFSSDVYEKLQDLYIKAFVEADANYEAADALVAIDADGHSVSPMLSERTWTASEYVTEREETAKKISKALSVDLKTAYKYIDDINSVARLIADDRARLDYEPNLDENATVLKPNSDYKYSVDMSTLCAKRLLFTGTFDAIQKALPNTVFDSEDIVALREMMQQRGYEVACGICYVESTRREIGRITQEFIDRYKIAQKSGKPISRINSSGKEVVLKSAGRTFSADKNYTPNLGELNTTDIDIVKRDHREVYDAYLAFMNARGQAKPKLLETRAEYKGEILKHFKSKSAVEARNNAGGLRLQSFSDFEVPHLIDMMQIVMDMSRVGLKSQAYTKVPAFAEVFGDTGVKINLSLIAKGDGLDANGNLIFDDVEGINHKEAFGLRDKYSKNVGTILVGKNDAHIIAAMADPRIDYIIPFHKSSWKESLYDALGLTGYDNYESTQHEKPIDKSRKISDYDPSEYWDFSKSGDENAQIYLQKCKDDGRIPKFPQFQGYPGYWKLLIDFKMYDNDGVGSPQEVVKPTFNTEASDRILREYKGGHKSFPVAKDVVTDFVKEHEENVKYSDRVVDLSDDNELSALVNGVHGAKRYKAIAEYILNAIEDKSIVFDDGLEAIVDKRDASHIAHGAGKHKVNQIAKIKDLINQAIIYAEENDVDHNKFNQFLYYESIVKYDKETFPLYLNLGRGKNDGKYHLYDITKKIRDTANRINGLERPKPNEGYAQENDISDKSISQDSQFVKGENENIPHSDRDSYAPTFYSHMGKVIDGIRLEKMGAGGVVSYLKGKGVKDEEIKWSGIEAFLEGKKSVTKADLQEFVAGSQLQIVEQMSGADIDLRYDGSNRAYNLYDSNGKVIDTFTYNEFLDGYVADSDEEIYANEIELREALRDVYGKATAPKWSDYRLDGGENYRELVFQLPNSTYSNNAMRGHWGQEAEGVLAHARIQDMTTTDGKKMLFIEEIQSDWHNEGHQKGYLTKEYEDTVAVYDKLVNDYEKKRLAFHKYVRSNEFHSDPDDVRSKKLKWLRGKMDTAEKMMQAAERDVNALKEKGMGDVPDAPFRNNYHEYVLKRLLRMAAEEGYDSIGWTTADIQSKRWSEDYAEGYRIEYDQDIPKFLRKYGKKWGATVGKTVVTGGTEVWSMDITNSMTDSVLYEGQVMYSERVTNQETLDFLENQEHITTYKSFVEIDGKLYSPMATKVKGDDGKYRLTNPSEIGVWQQAEEKPDSIPKFHKSGYGYYVLKKDDGGSVTAAYNPYEHSSNLVLNDQFEAAYQRPNLVTVECVIPKSEMTSGYKAKYAKDSTGYLDWKSGTVAGKLKGNKRKVYLSRWLKPVRILSEAEVATRYKDILGTKISVPFNVVTPKLLSELEKVGVKIDYEGSPGYQYRQGKKATDDDTKFSDRDTGSVSTRSLLANALESVAKNDIEKSKLKQYKDKIALIESAQTKLEEIRARANELRFTKGRTASETKTMRELDAEATRIANRISTYDKQLLDLESTTALKNVLEREKAMLRKRLEQKGKQALKAQKEKSAATVRELMTHHAESRKKAVEGRHKTEMRHKIKNVVSDLNKLLLNPTKEQHVPIGLQLPVAEALDAINMDTMNAEERVAYYNDLISKSSNPDEIAMLTKKRDFFEYRDANFKERIAALKNAYAEFKESDDPLIRNAHNETIEDIIKNTSDAVGNKSLKDMSFEQLEAVYNMYKAILATVRNSNKMFKEGRQETITEYSETVKNEVREVGGHKDRVLKLAKFFKKFGWNMLKPITAMKVIGSKSFSKLFDSVRAAEDTWAVDVGEAKQFYDEQKGKYNFKKWDFKKRYSFKDSTGTDFSLSLEQIMSLYAYSKRDQADKHLEVGGFIFDDAIEVTKKGKLGIPLKYEVNDANPYRLRKEDLLAVTDALTQEQKAFIDEMQTYLSDVMGAKGNEVSLAMYDIKLYNEKHYFPLKTSRYFREFDPEKSATPKVKNSGFSKKTVPQAGNPIVLSNFMDVWASHVNDMSMYHAFVLPLEDFMRVYNYSSTAGGYDSVQQYIKNAYGAEANQYIETLMNDLNGGARVDPSAGVINKGLSLFKKASVFASASVVIQQPSAIARALAYINPKYFVTSAPSAWNLVKHKAVWAEVKKYAPVAVIKEMGYFDTGLGRSTVEWIKGNQSIKDKVDDLLSKAPAIADELSWAYIWEAIKKETKATTNLTMGSDEFLKKCGERFTEIITNTQVYDSVLSRSGVMRSKDTGMKMATAFMAEPITSVNMMVDGILQGKRGNKKFAAATVGAVAASIILNSILVSLVYAARDDDEDETYLEKYLGSLTSELVDGFNPLTYIPFVKDIWSIAQGYDVERSDMSVVSKLWESVEGLFDEGEVGLNKVLDVTGSISSLFGIPLKNIIRDARGMYNLAGMILSDAPTTKGGVGDSIEDALTSSIPLWDRIVGTETKTDKLYDAIMSGDQAYQKRIESGYKDSKAVETAKRQALRDNDSRINEAAQARIDGDIAKYTRIAKEIIGEGYFSQNTVVAAINAEITSIKKGESKTESATASKVESIYKIDDYYSALVGRDEATAYAVKEDMIRTEVANGKDRDEAESNFNSRFASHLREMYEAGEVADYEAERMLVNYGEKSVDEAQSKVQYWAFKVSYPDYDLSEEAVKKYYSDVEPSGITINVYYDYTKKRAKCKGIDADGDGKTDSGSVKVEVLKVINSLPITSAQKDALYYLNGWSQSTISQAPWR
jgi:hypothetical protein